MARTFKVLSLLLGYPTQEIKENTAELAAALESEALLPEPQRRMVRRLIDDIAKRDLYDLQERYVLLFDRTRSLSLHLFEHVHGESRDRGQAMLDLKALYERKGYDVAAAELPDYLPLFLEFLSTQPAEEARDLLNQPLHVIAALRQRLKRRGSIYAGVFQALEAIARGKPAAEEVNELLEQPDDDPEDLEKLDEAWEDEPVTFGPSGDGGGCNPSRLVTRLRAAKRPGAGAQTGTNTQ